MKAKTENLVLTALKTTGYTLAGTVLTILIQTIPEVKPTDPTQALVWALVMVPLLSGGAKAVLRWIKWDPNRAAKK